MYLESARKFGFLFNTIFSLTGVALGVLSLVYILNEPRPELTARELLWGGLGTSLILVLTGILGMMCNMSQQSTTDPLQQRSAYKCYLMLSIVIAVILGSALRWSSVAVRRQDALKSLSHVWNKVPDETALAIQTMGQCCGFHNYKDRIQEPCIRFTEQVGCAQIMLRYYQRSVSKLLPIIWGILSMALFAIASATLLWIWGEKSCHRRQSEGNGSNTGTSNPANGIHLSMYTEEMPGTPKGQSYDEWRKTVFQ